MILGISPGGSADLLAAAIFTMDVFNDDKKVSDKNEEAAGEKTGRIKELIIS
jgi:hypothetical protein